MDLLKHTPRFDPKDAVMFAKKLYGIAGKSTPLPSERDQNFLLTTDARERFVLKIANGREEVALLEAQNDVLAHLGRRISFCPQVIPTLSGEQLTKVESQGQQNHYARLVTYLPGVPLGTLSAQSSSLLRDLGKKLGQMDRELADFKHVAFHRDFHWDLAKGPEMVRKFGPLILDSETQATIFRYLEVFERVVAPPLTKLRRSIIHNDANDYNIIASDSGAEVTGVIDFGDMVHSYTAAELGVAIAYIVLDKSEPLAAAAEVVGGYAQQYPLHDEEIEALYGLMLMRLCMSVCLAASQLQQQPDNDYLKISQRSIANALPALLGIDLRKAAEIFHRACNTTTRAETIAARERLLAHNLSIAYKDPVKIVRGEMQYLYDEKGRKYLDAYNNVAHVGHCNPRVVKAGQEQMALLNTNTRYLHDLINRYAERLTATLPPVLTVCFFLNSGSEANELAIRLARAHTNARDLIVLEHAYHGNTTTLIDISPYKHEGPGGLGAPSWVHKVPLPDTYRGIHRHEAGAAHKYAQHVNDAIAGSTRLCGFIAESLPSVAGQIVFPPGYLTEVYEAVHRAGGVCIADEVQTAYGRIGTNFWGFECYGVVPDIVVLGKPIGNGHPIGAAITTREIASSFDNGMEFFSTFGGNTVSCAIGLSVLEVVLEEKLQEHALDVGAQLLDDLRALQGRHDIIGDVRGSGFFLGIELVKSRDTLEPARAAANLVVNRLRERGILLGTDGPFHNVLKIRPPMPFDMEDAAHLVKTLDQVLGKGFPAEQLSYK